MQVLIVEDDTRLAAALAHILRDAGYGADVVQDGAKGLYYAKNGNYGAVVLDVMLPKMNGFDVVADLRRAGVSTPVIMLTARDGVANKVHGLDCGADDYMAKPFAPAELLARLRALTRRQGDVVFEKLRAGDLELDLNTHSLRCGEKDIQLSVKEFDLARVFLSAPKQVIDKDTLIAKVWGIESSAGDNNVEAYISFLRKKLRFLGSDVGIETLRGVGYRLCGTDE